MPAVALDPQPGMHLFETSRASFQPANPDPGSAMAVTVTGVAGGKSSKHT